MVLSMKATGTTTKPKVGVHSGMQKETYMWVSSKLIRQMDKELIHM